VSLSTAQGENALARGEVPVGCVFVHGGEVIARAGNRTNELFNARRCCLRSTETANLLSS
jgi:tRNA(Arg) A34 adenosine deaminase TadA